MLFLASWSRVHRAAPRAGTSGPLVRLPVGHSGCQQAADPREGESIRQSRKRGPGIGETILLYCLKPDRIVGCLSLVG